MNDRVYAIHRRLKIFPPAQFLYIIFARLTEQGLHPTLQWIQDKLHRRIYGSPPTELSRVLPRLFVGGQHSHRGLTAMRDMGIGAVLNLRRESDDAARNAAMEYYLWLPTTDDAPPTLGDLQQGVAFITAQIAAGRGVYIHCASGVGRAPTMAAAYLTSLGMSQTEAWETIRRVRPFIRPTPPQIEQVHRFSEAQQSLPRVAMAQKVTLQGRRLQEAYEQIMEDETLTSDLSDAEASILLQWAEAEVKRLVNETKGLDDETAWRSLTPRLQYLRRYLRKIARHSAQADDPQATLQSNLIPPTYPEKNNEEKCYE